jgi:hypothetical protein
MDDEDSDDLNRMEDGDVGLDEQRDFMQEDGEGNSKAKGDGLGFSNTHTKQRGSNKNAVLLNKNVNSQGGHKDMQIDDDMDHLLDGMSPENRYEEEQYEVDGDSTVYDPTIFVLEEQNSAA